MSFQNPLDTCLLIGDSITQTCGAGTLYQRLAEYYQRRLDIVNRGLGGYNTTWMISTLSRILPTRTQITSSSLPHPRLITIWLGTNDASLPPALTHTPLEIYKSNLHTMLSMLQSPTSPYYSPEASIILFTPGPVLAEVWRKGVADWAILSGLMTPEEMVSERDHDPGVMRLYAEGCLEVGRQAGVEVVDVYKGIMDDAGGDGMEVLLPYFTDGLHMTPKGYEVVFKLFTHLIESKYPKLIPTNIPSGIPEFEQLGKGDNTAVGDAVEQAYRAYWKG